MQWTAIAAIIISLTTLSLTALSMRRSARRDSLNTSEKRADDLEESGAECQKRLKSALEEKNDLLYEVLQLRRKIDEMVQKRL